jgi:hypothetical protein
MVGDRHRCGGISSGKMWPQAQRKASSVAIKFEDVARALINRGAAYFYRYHVEQFEGGWSSLGKGVIRDVCVIGLHTLLK